MRLDTIPQTQLHTHKDPFIWNTHTHKKYSRARVNKIGKFSRFNDDDNDDLE